MTSDFSFLHVADLHIDSPLRGLSAYEGAPAEQLRLAVREAFTGLVEAALERRVAFVVLAGDIFDGDWPDYESGLWFSTQMRALGEAGIHVYAISGNHDAESKVTLRLQWPDNVHFFSTQDSESLAVEGVQAVLHGQSYAEARTETNLALGYPEAVPDTFNIGVLHTALEGREGHGRYAPCTLEDLRSKSYDYWALGHVHTREVVSEKPWVVFPGNIQGRHIGECGAKGGTLVVVEEGRVASVESLVHDVARWQHIKIDATGLVDEDALLNVIEEALKEEVVAADGRLLAVRLTVGGATALDAKLRLEEVRWRQELRALGSRVSSELWLEKTPLQTRPAEVAGEIDSGLPGLARRLVDAELSEDELGDLTRELERLATRLPGEVLAVVNPGKRETLSRKLESSRLYLSALLGEVAPQSEGQE